jgi:hypothetical protein
MAKKASANGRDRNDPRANKSLAIRNVLKDLPTAKASDVAATVKSKYGHEVSVNMIYMIKTKLGVKKAHKAAGRKGKVNTAMNTPTAWTEAIKAGRDLIRSTGSVANAKALIDALGD